jgi:predicted dehydrogenase
MIYHEKRKQPKMAVEAFAGKNLQAADFDEVTIDTEDFASVLVRLGDRCRGAYTVSQVSAGCKNRFQMEIFGTKAGVIWNQEQPDALWIGHRNERSQLMLKDPSMMYPEAAKFADLPGGHSEGYDDAHKQLYRRFYERVADPSKPVNYPTFADGARGMVLIEKVLESSAKRAWVDIGE